MKEFNPVFNDLVPTTDGEYSADVWDEFAYWARYFFDEPDFDANERDYKLGLGQKIAAARSEFEGGEGANWLTTLTRALRSGENNLSHFTQHEQYLKWLGENPDQRD